MSEPIASVKTFVGVWAALLMFTAITVAVAYLNLGAFSVVVALVIATIKSLLVVLFFMEARYSHAITKVVMIAGIFWLMIMLLLSLSDFASRSWSHGL
jgi:cytochrome c oxidase subunit IV